MADRTRIALAFAAAALGPAMAFGLVFAAFGLVLRSPVAQALGFGLWACGEALAFAVPITLLIGVPAFLMVRNRVRPVASSALLGGASVASGGYLLLMFGLWALDGFPRHTVGGAAGALPLVFLMGAISGLIFWTIAAPALRRG